eukprot:1267202-Pyramimonas_sp.AAC.1
MQAKHSTSRSKRSSPRSPSPRPKYPAWTSPTSEIGADLDTLAHSSVALRSTSPRTNYNKLSLRGSKPLGWTWQACASTALLLASAFPSLSWETTPSFDRVLKLCTTIFESDEIGGSLSYPMVTSTTTSSSAQAKAPSWHDKKCNSSVLPGSQPPPSPHSTSARTGLMQSSLSATSQSYASMSATHRRSRRESNGLTQLFDMELLNKTAMAWARLSPAPLPWQHTGSSVVALARAGRHGCTQIRIRTPP